MQRPFVLDFVPQGMYDELRLSLKSYVRNETIDFIKQSNTQTALNSSDINLFPEHSYSIGSDKSIQKK